MQLVANRTEPTATTRASRSTEHDMPEVAAQYHETHLRDAGYRSEGRSARGIQQLLNSGAPVSNYNTNSYGSITFRALAEKEQPKIEKQHTIERLVADGELQSRLESLCESLRSRY